MGKTSRIRAKPKIDNFGLKLPFPHEPVSLFSLIEHHPGYFYLPFRTMRLRGCIRREGGIWERFRLASTYFGHLPGPRRKSGCLGDTPNPYLSTIWLKRQEMSFPMRTSTAHDPGRRDRDLTVKRRLSATANLCKLIRAWYFAYYSTSRIRKPMPDFAKVISKFSWKSVEKDARISAEIAKNLLKLYCSPYPNSYHR